jgi:hypothetical protein
MKMKKLTSFTKQHKRELRPKDGMPRSVEVKGHVNQINKKARRPPKI